MMKWISNYSPNKIKSPELKEKHPDEWRKKRNSVFVSDLTIINQRSSYLETLIPAEVYFYLLIRLAYQLYLL